MRRIYFTPNTEIFEIRTAQLVMNSGDSETDTIPVYPDDPQEVGNSLARQRSVWNDEENEDNDF